MRIAVIHNLPPGGARRRLSAQMAHLGEDVHEVCLASSTPVRDDARVIAFRAGAPRVPRGFRVPLRYVDFVGLLTAWWRAAAHVRALGVDVVYANPCRQLQAPAALLSDMPPAVYFCDEPRRVDTDPLAIASRNRTTRPLYGPMYAGQRRADRRAVRRATHLATNSRFTAGEIERVYARTATVVPMGVDDAFLGGSPARTAPGQHLLCVGTLIPSKGHDLVVRAAARTAQRWPVVVVAPRPAPEEEQRLRDLAADVGVALDVRVAVTDAELRALYSDAQATLYLAHREPLGLAALEAQACGSPVIVADEGGLPETVEDGVTGWVTPRDAGAAAAIVDRLDDVAVRDRVGSAAAARASTITWKRSAASVSELLERVAA